MREFSALVWDKACKRCKGMGGWVQPWNMQEIQCPCFRDYSKDPSGLSLEDEETPVGKEA